MDKKNIIKVGAGIVLFVVLAFVSWQAFLSPTEGESLSEAEAEELVLERFNGEIIGTKLNNGDYEIQLTSDLGDYKIHVSKEKGEIVEIARTKVVEQPENLDETEIKKIITEAETGDLKSLSSRGSNKQLFYDAVLENDDTEIKLTLDGVSGTVIKRSETALEKTQDKDLVQNDQQEKEDVKAKEKAEKEKEKERKQQEKEAAKKQEEEKPKNISEQEAIQIALDTVYGEVDDVDLETVNGQLFYFIEIERDDDVEADIQINAITGEVISIEWDD